MKRIMRTTAAFLISICLLTGSGAVLAAASEDPVVDVGVVETSTKNNGVLIKENKTSGSEYVYTVSTGDGRQYSGSSDEPFGEITVNADRIDVDASSSLPANGVMVNNETTADVVINVQGEISVDEDYKASTSADGTKGILSSTVFQYRIWREEDTLHASCFILPPTGEQYGPEEITCDLSPDNAKTVKNWLAEQVEAHPEVKGDSISS